MLALRCGIYIFLGFLSVALAYNISPHVIEGIPEFVNVTTEPFVQIGNNYYIIENKVWKTWYAAYEACRKLGASLISFDTIEEWNLVNNHLNDTGIYKRYWTSATILADRRNFTWFSTGQPMSLDIWYPGEPNNLGGGEFCVEMGMVPAVPKYWGLNDRGCLREVNYICKAQQPKTALFVVDNFQSV